MPKDDKDRQVPAPTSKSGPLADYSAVPSTEGKLFPKLYVRSQTKLAQEKAEYSRAATELINSESERADALTRLGRSVRRLERLPEIIDEDDKDWAHARELAKLDRQQELLEAKLKVARAREDIETQKATKDAKRALELRRLEAQERMEAYDIAHANRQIALEDEGKDDDEGGPEEIL